jgi:superfamily II DNA or RNA helicase
MDTRLTNTFKYNVVYIYEIPSESHKNRLKIGETKLSGHDISQKMVEAAARRRIDQQTKTSDVEYNLLYAEIAVTHDNKYFRDNDVHNVLLRSGYERKNTRMDKKFGEWFEIPLKTALNAILVVKEGRKSLDPNEKITKFSSIQFRPSQLDAIKLTRQAIKAKRKAYLWNAKMRFGKTITALQVTKEEEFKKTLIITHRPIVSDDWYKDFNNVFYDTNYKFGSKKKGEDASALLEGSAPFVYFASIQDLRLSENVIKDSRSVAKGLAKNQEIFEADWDFVVVDEAHEGTKSELALILNEKIHRNFTLHLSGTPFNLLEDYEEDDVYTWDYVREQKEKTDWDENHPGEPNPYIELPQLSMLTYDLNRYIEDSQFKDIEDKAFNFKEFFRTDESGGFIHERHVRQFLDTISTESTSQFPYSTEEFRNYLKNTLWMLPGVKEAKALSRLLRVHPIFGQFEIANVAGDGDEEVRENDARQKVIDAFEKNDHTITLTCGKLTTGVSIPEWTAVFMLSNTTSSTTYLQTAFRVQTPANIDGKMKTDCYVFDFAPDRTLKIVSEAARLNTGAGKINTPAQRVAMGEFLNFCPIISATNGAMQPYDVSRMLTELKKAAVQRVARNGFDDINIYNDELLKLDDIALQDFQDLQAIIGASQQAKKVNEIVINTQGFYDEEYEKIEQLKKKPKKLLTDEEKEQLKLLKAAKEQRNTMISILRGISIRIPMLIYGADVDSDEDITIKKFIELVDDESWTEFMPVGVNKETFRKFTKYYDEEVFVGAGRDIRLKALASDLLLPFERIEKISEIFASFKNPDKETVLTPWRVVNMHVSDMFGGNNFNHLDEDLNLPERFNNGEVTEIWDKEDAKILEINSKSGLYPLLAAYNLYTERLSRQHQPEDKVYRDLWNGILSENIYVLSKTRMAEQITKRTLAGYKNTKLNITTVENIINKFKDESYSFEEDLQIKFKIGGDMKFDIIIGNPPYQQSDGGHGTSAMPIYQTFVEQAIKLKPRYASMIMPARWYSGGKGLDEFRDKMLHDRHLRKIVDYPEAIDAFQGVQIKGGVMYFLWDRDDSGDVEVSTFRKDRIISTLTRPLLEDGATTFIRYNEAIPILKKVQSKHEESLTNQVSSMKPFGLRTFVKAASKSDPNKVKLYQNGGIGYIDRNEITKNKELIDKYKVLIPRAGSGSDSFPHSILGKPFVAEPNTACTETYIVLGSYDDKRQCDNLTRYVTTRFFRLMVLLIKSTQDAAGRVYRHVPMQDFTQEWTDEKLYKKYGITDEEITFIESMIRPMEVADYERSTIKRSTGN